LRTFNLKAAVKDDKIVQVLKSIQAFELLGGLSSGTGRVSTQKFKSQSDFGQMRHF
jgi:tRNA(Phe) wybutosine-synthesizing methylase Tyw3